MKPQRIGDLSRNSGVNIETIRYYERIGLLAKQQQEANVFLIARQFWVQYSNLALRNISPSCFV